VTGKKEDQSGRQWDVKNETGLRYHSGPLDVEYHRDIKPIFARSCAACHTANGGREPAGKLVLDDDKLVPGPRWDLGNVDKIPATYNTLAGHYIGYAKYARGFQSRRSPLIWKVFGRRLDGLPEKPAPDKESLHKRILAEGDFKGSIMPPPDAVKAGKVQPLSDEDRRTLVRWIDLGCPIDLDVAKKADERGTGWFFDDQRPTLTLTYPQPGVNPPLSRILVGMHDYYTGLDPASFSVTADFDVDGIKAGENLASRFKDKGDGVWELTLKKPVAGVKKGLVSVGIKDKEGNVNRVERTFSIR
jgi:hypothetical protein